MAGPSSSFATTQFGAPIGDYRGSKARIFLIVCGILLLLLGAFFVSVALTDPSGPAADIIAVVVFLAAALYSLWTVFSWRGAHAQLFEQGFVVSRAGKTTTARWEDVSDVKQNVVRMRYYGMPVWTSHLYTVTLANGSTLRINNAFGQVGKLGDAVQRMSANALLPRALAAFQSGAMLPFGQLSLSQAGISNGKETMPWSDFNQLTFSNGRVIITRKGKRLRWAAALVKTTPNIYVLTGLVNYAQRGIR